MSEFKENSGFIPKALFDRELDNFNTIISLLNDASVSFSDTLSSVAKLLPFLCHHPEYISAEIFYSDQVFQSENFIKSDHYLTIALSVNGSIAGSIVMHPVKSSEKHFLIYDLPLSIENLSVNNLVVSVKNLVEIYLTNSENKLKLEQSESNYLNIIETISEVIYDVDMSGNILFASQSVKNVLGYDQKEILGKNIFSFIYPEDRPNVLHSLQNLESRKTNFLEYRYIAKDGKLRWVHSSTSPRYKRGKLVGGSGVLSDITEKKEYELKLLEQQKLHLQSQELGKFGYWKFNLQTSELYWSDETFRIFELDSENFTPSYDAFLNIIHPADRGTVNHAYQNSLKNKENYDIVHRLLMPDGRIKYVNEKCTTSFDENGIPMVSMGTIQDITHQLELENQIHEKEERLRQIAEQS